MNKPPESNLTKVSHERWLEAQKWEKNVWIQDQISRSKFGKNILWPFFSFLGIKPKFRGDDWNYWWKEQFNSYSFLPKTVDNAIELGCGPFTNMRLIFEQCKPQHLVLSDPLIMTYVSFKNTFLSHLYHQRLCVLDDHPIEEIPFKDNYFDLTIMINVLDHVQDAELCISNAVRITKPGGFILIGNDLTNDEDQINLQNKEGEIGHPIKLDHTWLDLLLLGRVTPIVHKILPREEGREPAHHYGVYILSGKKIDD